jgi:hypothetical protein
MPRPISAGLFHQSHSLGRGHRGSLKWGGRGVRFRRSDMRDPDAPDERVGDFSLPGLRIQGPGGEASWFRERLRAEGVTLHPSSYVARALDALEEMARGIAGRWQPAPGEDQGEKIRSASGILFLIRAVRCAVERRPNAFASKWHLFRGPDVNLVAYQGRTQERDKMWEVFIAALCECVFDDVVLANHENPDIRCSARGEDWGIECKILYTDKPGAQRDQLLDKAAQLEEAGISCGVIAVNITGLLDHRANVDSFRYFPAPHGVSQRDLNADLDRSAQAVIDRINTPHFKRRLFKNERPSGPRSSARLILFWSQTVALSGGYLVLACNTKWIAYEQRTVRDEAFIRRILLAGTLLGS